MLRPGDLATPQDGRDGSYPNQEQTPHQKDIGAVLSESVVEKQFVYGKDKISFGNLMDNPCFRVNTKLYFEGPIDGKNLAIIENVFLSIFEVQAIEDKIFMLMFLLLLKETTCFAILRKLRGLMKNEEIDQFNLYLEYHDYTLDQIFMSLFKY